DPHRRAESAIARAQPEKSRRVPVALPAKGAAHGVEVGSCGKDPVGADESVNLKVERVKRGEEDPAQGAEPDPAGSQVGGLAEVRSEPALQQRRLLFSDLFEHRIPRSLWPGRAPSMPLATPAANRGRRGEIAARGERNRSATTMSRGPDSSSSRARPRHRVCQEGACWTR